MNRVVVSVGTDHHPFERALDWIAIAQEQLGIHAFVQRGATPVRPGIDTTDYLAQAELDDAFATADAVVCHGGPGTIAAARRHGHRPIVIPRNPDLGEHVDDHQQRYAAQLADDDIVDLATTPEELVNLLSVVRPRAEHDLSDARAAVEQFAEIVERLFAGELPRRRWRDRIKLKRSA